jgi:dTDP-4-amino-4,6-dideoxygalactose transaminase
MHLQPVFAEAQIYGGGVAEELFLRGLCLPSGAAVSVSDVDEICEIVIREIGR